MSILKRLGTTAVLSVAMICSGPLSAQGLFDPVVIVNDDVVTEYEVEQRQLFLTVLNAPGSSREAVIETLIDERLRSQAVDEAGLTLTPEGLEAGIAEFAGRTGLEPDEFISQLEQNGVERATFVAFLSVGLTWRDLIAGRFGRRLQITEDEIDRALASSAGAGGIRVLVSEIIIPAPANRRAQVEELAREIARSQSEAEFSDYARRYSATATRDAGGRLPWQPLAQLAPVLRPLLLSLAPGEVTDPLPLPDAVALFQLRGIQETSASEREYASIEYAAYYIPGGRTQAGLSEAQDVRAEVDSCDDLYATAQGQPEETLVRETLPPADLPQDIALELSKLDPGEVSTALTRNDGQTLVFLMLCGRTAAVNQEVAREDAAAALRSRTINTYAEGFLAQLRADARIVTP
ncbi:peptidylprolyl isomerase [uncultured Roseobacter sp.]|uniref:peptidylprolyl isomerase n=1 Tax=uncultured Roseobacter sp. TaxID=114847 RepID=UPI00263905E6|nr:peptidylprolyl isomerase [uncultured Roseobacter sp.]